MLHWRDILVTETKMFGWLKGPRKLRGLLEISLRDGKEEVQAVDWEGQWEKEHKYSFFHPINVTLPITDLCLLPKKRESISFLFNIFANLRDFKSSQTHAAPHPSKIKYAYHLMWEFWCDIVIFQLQEEQQSCCLGLGHQTLINAGHHVVDSYSVLFL